MIVYHLCAVNSATVGALLSKKYIRVPHPNPDVSVSALMDYGLTVRAFFQTYAKGSKEILARVCGGLTDISEISSNFCLFDK